MKKSVLILLIVGTLAMVSNLSCSSDNIEGKYLCGKSFLDIRKENDQLLLNIYKYNSKETLATPKVTIPLKKEDKIYKSQTSGLFAKISISKSEKGIMMIKETTRSDCYAVDLTKGKAIFKEDFVKKTIKENIITGILQDAETKSYFCGSNGLSLRKRKHLKELLKKGTITVKDKVKEEKPFYDNYKVNVEMSFPDVETLLENEKVCTEYKRSWGSKSCQKWGTRNYIINTKAYTIPLVLDYQIPKFDHIFIKIPYIHIDKIDAFERRAVERAFCNNIFIEKDKMAYSEKKVKSSPKAKKEESI